MRPSIGAWNEVVATVNLPLVTQSLKCPHDKPRQAGFSTARFVTS
jgi:hypothetical protein